ncbi:hypothetical protein ACFO5Q_13195 [Kordiimonas lipolytica]|uniref:Transposase zinc-ribbon domain-containing protein n=1 Tax=Kordiimonas lipolytica TaxID=1662421 RepID=A0ABV8UC77_9PROT|nr:hypothetical protein [Kordiimonas lipolytica]
MSRANKLFFLLLLVITVAGVSHWPSVWFAVFCFFAWAALFARLYAEQQKKCPACGLEVYKDKNGILHAWNKRFACPHCGAKL